MSAKEEKVDPRVRRTKQMLREALIELIAEKGYDAISVLDITKRATLNRGTFYLHYRDKEDLLTQTIDDILTDLVTGMRESRALNQSIFDDGRTVEPLPDLVYVFEHIAKHERFYQVMMGEKGQHILLYRLLNVFVEVLDSRLTNSMANNIHPMIPKEILIHYAASAYLGVISWWLKNGMPYTPRYMATQLTRLRLQHLQKL